MFAILKNSCNNNETNEKMKKTKHGFSVRAPAISNFC